MLCGRRINRSATYAYVPNEPPDLPGIPGLITKAAHNFRKATSIFPPPGVGIGVGLGIGCGFGWPMRKAYGPPRALCGPGIAVGIGFGYGQGIGKRFGQDVRSADFRNWVKAIETRLDSVVERCLAMFKRLRGAKNNASSPQ